MALCYFSGVSIRWTWICSLAGVLACGSPQSQSAKPDEPLPLPPTTTRVPKNVLAKISAQYMAELRKCTDPVMKKTPAAAGEYRMELELHADGKVTALGITGSDKALRDCIESHVKTWTFAPPRDKKNNPVASTITIPLQFTAPKKKSSAREDAILIGMINQKYMAGIHACHNLAIKSDPKAMGKVKLHFTINVDGTITMANVMGMPQAELLACIRRKVLTWQLPAPLDATGKPTTKSINLTIKLGKTQ